MTSTRSRDTSCCVAARRSRKSADVVKAGDDQHVLPFALNLWQTTGQDGVVEVFIDQTLRNPFSEERL